MARKQIKVNYSSKIARRRERRAKFKVGLFVVGPILCLVLFVFLMRLDALQIKSIAVSGLSSMNPDEIKTEVTKDLEGNFLFFIPKKNILFIDDKNIANALTSEFGRLKSVKIKTRVSGELGIEVEERISEAIWCNQNNDCYLMDGSGLIFSIAAKEEQRNKIIFKGATVQNQGEDLRYFKYAKELDDFLVVADYLTQREVEIFSFEISSDEKASVFTSLGEIIFNPLDKSILSAIDSAMLVYENLKKTNPNIRFEYIDVRFGSKVYYKTF